jgi:adenosylcobinamide kinase/adenosylcobinamide-phosphate guanylyltransferase
MRVTLLGTGSADGWPNPFCRCTSCTAERDAGRSRRPSAALVDDVVLIDAGPTMPHLPPGLDLTDIEHVLITHGHPDHLHPAFLLSRSWTQQERVLHIWGPPAAIDLCRDWCGPDDPVQLHPIHPGTPLELATRRGTLHATALPAQHGHGNGDALADEALLYSVTAMDGGRLLYATDTGPFDPVSCGITSEAFDVVLLDATFGDTVDHGTGHLDLATLPAQVAALRGHGAIGPQTRVLATHLSHHNPPSDLLRTRLASHGIELPDDLDVIDTHGRARRTLILGGARSGKSSYAERLLAERASVTYVATGGSRDDDPEWQLRISAHRARRPAHWTTVESTDVAATLRSAEGAVLVDCLALWLTAQLDHIDAWVRIDNGEYGSVVDDARGRIEDLVQSLDSCSADVVLVSNEVGMGVVPGTASGRLFRDLLGILNMAVAQVCDTSTLLVAGQPLTIKESRWRS